MMMMDNNSNHHHHLLVIMITLLVIIIFLYVQMNPNLLLLASWDKRHKTSLHFFSQLYQGLESQRTTLLVGSYSY